MPNTEQIFIVAISGCSCSGKSTLAQLLQSIFPKSAVLHQDSFFKSEMGVPVQHGLPNWECSDAIDIPYMTSVLSYIRSHASLPLSFQHEYKNTIGKCDIPSPETATLKSRVSSLLTLTQNPKIVFVDGLLLYGPSVSMFEPFFDVKIFVRASYGTVKTRRQQRERRCLGRLKNFWPDPPGYMDVVVWPEYVKAYSWLFEDGDVEGRFRAEALQSKRINALIDRPVDVDIVETLDWAVDTIVRGIFPRFKANERAHNSP